MVEAVRLRKELGSACALGFQMVLLPENRHEALLLAQRVKDMGADYLVIKPYSQHPQSNTQEYAVLSYADLEKLALSLDALNTDSFSVILRHKTMQRIHENHKRYQSCQALPFWSYTDAGGDLWGCSVFLGDERFAYGNLLESSFDEIWNGAKRRDSLAWSAAHLDVQKCRPGCRMDSVNAYLWKLTHPDSDDNFI